MERLDFEFYRALFDQLEMFETHFLQLQRDYARELRGEILFFAIDFSELYNYIHFASKDVQRIQRVELNTYILNTLHDRLTILPGAVGELLADLERVVPKQLVSDFRKGLYNYPAVGRFLSAFPQAIHDEDRLIELYGNAERELRGALGTIFDVVVKGLYYTPIQALRKLLEEKLTPIEGVRQIGHLSTEAKHLSQLVGSHLTVSRPTAAEGNQADALNFIVAFVLNQKGSPPSKRYITIYSQSIHLIRACRSHESLQWDNDYLIRELKYFQFRTKLQEMFQTIEERHAHVIEWAKLCQKLKAEISKLVDIHETLGQKPLKPSLELIDLYRKFDEECRQILSFRPELGIKPITREEAEGLYETLRNQKRFAGELDDAYEVLKEHLRAIQKTLQAFSPVPTDTDNSREYKANLRRWLGIKDVEASKSEDQSRKGD